MFIGLTIGAPMQGEIFLRAQNLIIFGLGFAAICIDTATDTMLRKIIKVLSEGKINPMVGAAIMVVPLIAP